MNYFNLGVMGFIVGLSGAMLPGPMLVYTVSRVLQGRARNVIGIVFGHIIIEALVIILLLFGLKQIIGSKIVGNFLAIFGGGALILIGAHIIFKAGHMKIVINPVGCLLSNGVNKKINFSSGLIWGGIFFTAFNPTFPAWWVSVGVTLLFRALSFGLLGVVVFVLGHWLADFVWYFLVGLCVSRGKLWLSEKRYQLALRIVGIILIGLGSWFVWTLRSIT
ncbi:MAG: LysE family translocator [Candidatus Omnitrophica bacterium]|nr:LysE family translocator [Candidatus Omnitrophota bacterium]MBU1523984.1 LysE family translocator [Candidatus Omnitrophota bacterium]MBU2436936.1 LysE family translocator [Candidatus Omnitrophota bacterium]